MISGPAGSGKSSLALAIVKAAVQAGRSEGAALATASPTWTAEDTVGRVGPDGFSQGHVLSAAGKKKWLLIDEIDRAELDQAFGDLSSFLGGLPLSLPDGSREVAAPADWRIVATRDSGAGAFDGSSALLRRFAQVHLPRPSTADLEQAIDAATEGDPTSAAAVKRLAGRRPAGARRRHVPRRRPPRGGAQRAVARDRGRSSCTSCSWPTSPPTCTPSRRG